MSQAATGTGDNAFDTETRDGVTYLTHDVVAQREGVYSYPDPTGGIRKEFVSFEELAESIEGKDQLPLVLRHPERDDGTPSLTQDPRANFVEVGVWDNLRETESGDGIAGKVLIRENELDEHDGLLRKFVKQVRRNGIAGVSTGYDIDRAPKDPGRYNGIQYKYKQKGLDLDHLALLPDEQGDCSIEDGCGVGRANDDPTARVNHHIPDPVEDMDEEERVTLLTRVGQALGLGDLVGQRTNQSISVHTPSYSGSKTGSWDGLDMEDFDTDDLSEIDNHFIVSKSGFPPESFGDLNLEVVDTDGQLVLEALRSAHKLAGQVDGLSGDKLDRVKTKINNLAKDNFDEDFTSRDNMDHDELVDELVDEHDFTRENIAHLKGCNCLERIHERFTDMGDNGDGGGDDGGDDDDIFTEEQLDRINEVVSESVPSAEDIANEIEVPTPDNVDEEDLSEKVVEKVEKEQQFKQNVAKVAESDAFPNIDSETAEKMGEDALNDLAEQVDEAEADDDDEGGEDGRQNFAGRPFGNSFDAGEHGGDDLDIPVAGSKPETSEGDD